MTSFYLDSLFIELSEQFVGISCTLVCLLYTTVSGVSACLCVALLSEDAAPRLRRESMGLDLAGHYMPRPPPAVDPRRLSLYLPPTQSPTTPPSYNLYTRRSMIPPRRLPPSLHDADTTTDYDHHRMTDSLSEIQGDIQRLSSQQQQIQGLMRNGQPQPPPPSQQFYLHDQVTLTDEGLKPVVVYSSVSIIGDC